MTMKYARVLSTTLMIAFVLAACGDSGPTSTTADDSETSTGTTEVASSSSTNAGTSTTSAATTEATDGGSSDGSSTTDATTGVACEAVLEPGDNCSLDCECLSAHCFTVPLVGGSCGECEVDDDCPDGGCTIPNPWGGEGSMCNAGEPGKGCETDEVCSDPSAPYCATIIEAQGLFALMTCSECRDDDDCGGDTPHCAPEVDLDAFTGILRCLPDGALKQDQPCQHPNQPDLACASGLCSLTSVQGVLDVGICGECLSDADCDQGQTCEDAWVDLGGSGIEDLHGSACV